MTPSALCIAAPQISNNQLRGERKCVCRGRVKHFKGVVISCSVDCLTREEDPTNTLPIIEMRAPSNFGVKPTAGWSQARRPSRLQRRQCRGVTPAAGRSLRGCRQSRQPSCRIVPGT